MDLAGQTSGGQWWCSLSLGTSFVSRFWARLLEPAVPRDVVVGDFNDDGLEEIAVLFARGGGYVVGDRYGFNFGGADRGWRDGRAGDFDGDGKTDLAARTSAGEWWVFKSNSTPTVIAGGFTESLWGTWDETAGWRTFPGEFKPTVT
jgi:hypothetical protein